jgi:anti-sigma B factor antagonist
MPSPTFKVASRHEREGVVVALSGELDLAGAERLTAALADAQASGEPLTVDLTDLDFIDSSGLGVLVRFNNAAQVAGYPYRVIAGPPRVHRAFVLSGLDRALPFSP